MITFAKGITNGAVPMGGVRVSSEHPRCLHALGNDYAIELFHGYTYSGHPLGRGGRASPRSNSIATKGCSSVRRTLEPNFRDAVHALKGTPTSSTSAMSAWLRLSRWSRPTGAGKRGYETLRELFFEEDLVRAISGDIIVLIATR